MNTKVVAATASLITLLLATHAAAEDGAFFGPLRARDLTPFGNLRLDMRPAHVVFTEPGSWAIEAEFGYQNTWALSPEVEKYLVSLEPTGRRSLGTEEMDAILALPGENYLLDIETGSLDLTLHYKATQHWSLYTIVSALLYQGGFLDGSIEKFHDTFGFSTFGRPALARNSAALIYDLKGAQVSLRERPTDGGLTDPTFGLRYSGINLGSKWGLILEGALKVPVSGKRLLLSTGRLDYGLQACIHRLGERHALYANIAAVYYGGTSQPAQQDAQILPTFVVAYEYKWTPKTNLNLQAYVSESVYSHRQTDLRDLLATKYQYSVGIRHSIEDWVMTFGFTENVQNVNNTPDVGFQLGVAWIPHRRKQ